MNLLKNVYKTSFYVLLIILIGVLIFNQLKFEKLKKETVSIHMYNERCAYSKYQTVNSYSKNLIIQELLKNNKIDSILLKNYDLDDQSLNIPIEKLNYIKDSLLANWYETINYMWMDNINDSTQIKNSYTYNNVSKPIIDKLRNN